MKETFEWLSPIPERRILFGQMTNIALYCSSRNNNKKPNKQKSQIQKPIKQPPLPKQTNKNQKNKSKGDDSIMHTFYVHRCKCSPTFFNTEKLS